MKVALVHDYLADFGGAERVLLALSEMYPEAPIYTAFMIKGSPAAKVFEGKRVVESWAAKIPGFGRKLHSPLRFLAPKIWGSFDFSGYDVVISSSSWFMTKGIVVPENCVHISYVHTPPRNLYGYSTGYWHQRWPVVKWYATVVNNYLRQYDYESAQKALVIVANSKEIQGRIKKFWRRESKVIYPPVSVRKPEVRSWKLEDRKYYLTGGRLVEPKHFDIAIEAANRLGVPLKVFGVGPEENRLRGLVGPSVEFLGKVKDEELVELYAGAKAFIVLANDEDFGITPVEAMMCGTPVVAHRAAGYLESVVEGETGVFVDELTAKAVAEGIRKFEAEDWKVDRIRGWAEKFSKERFVKEMGELIDYEWEKKRAV